MASIYDKALKWKDFSGIVDQDALASKALAADDARVLRSSTSNSASGAGAGVEGGGGGGRGEGKKMSKEERKKAEDKRDVSKAGADVGKIVNLMAGDANRVGVSLLHVLILVLVFGGVPGLCCRRLVGWNLHLCWCAVGLGVRGILQKKKNYVRVRAPMSSFDSDDRSWDSARSERSNILSVLRYKSHSLRALSDRSSSSFSVVITGLHDR